MRKIIFLFPELYRKRVFMWLPRPKNQLNHNTVKHFSGSHINRNYVATNY